jgi:polygalacturonase
LLDGTRQRRLKRRGGPIGRIKLGTESGGGFRNVAISNCIFEHCRGLALEQVDGGVLEDIVISNIAMRNVSNSPIFIRRGARLRRPDTSEPGPVRRIQIDNLVASNVALEQGILIAGLPGFPVEDVTLTNIRIRFAGGGTAEQARHIVSELAKEYPEPYLFGVLPAWGLFVRHATGLNLQHVDLRVNAPDSRPAAALDDVADVRLSSLNLTATKNQPMWSLANARELLVRDVTRLPNGSMSNVAARLLH